MCSDYGLWSTSATAWNNRRVTCHDNPPGRLDDLSITLRCCAGVTFEVCARDDFECEINFMLMQAMSNPGFQGWVQGWGIMSSFWKYHKLGLNSIVSRYGPVKTYKNPSIPTKIQLKIPIKVSIYPNSYFLGYCTCSILGPTTPAFHCQRHASCWSC